MNKIFIKIYPLFILLGLWFAFSYPFFLQHKIPFPTTYQVSHFAPWDAYKKNWGPIKSEAFPDVITQMYPWKYLTIKIEKTDHIPFWNPYSFAGAPLLANFQSAALSPFNLLFFIFTFPYAWSLLILFQPLLAGIFMYIFIREMGVGKIGSLISSTAFMFCGFITVWMPYGTLSMAAVFLPLILFSIYRSFKKTSIIYLVILALGVCFSIFSGHFQTSLYVLLFSFLFFFYCSYLFKDKKKALIVLLAFIAGIFLSLPQILPSIEFYLYAPRSDNFLHGGGIPFYYLITVFAPDFFGNPVTRNDIFGNYAEWASFVGVIPFILSLLGLTFKKRNIAQFFTFTAIIFTILALATPLQYIIQALKLPVISTSNPPRIIILASFSLAVLAGFGTEKLSSFMRDKKIKQIVVIYSILSAIIIVAFIALMVSHAGVEMVHVSEHNIVLPLALLLVSGFAILATTVLNKKKLIPFVLIFLLILTLIDSLRFAQKWMVFDSQSLLYMNTPVIDEIQKIKGNGRIYGNLEVGVVDDYYGLSSLEGYDPLYSEKYGEFIATASTGKITKSRRSVVFLGRRGLYADRVLNLLGVTLFFEPKADVGQGWAFPVWDKPQYKNVYGDEKIELFKNTKALARVTLFSSYRVASGKKALSLFYSPHFNYKHVLLLDRKPTLIPDLHAIGSGKIVLYSPDKIKISVNTNGSQLLFLSDSYYPGWSASIDGINTPIMKADYAFRAISVPKGKHTVIFEYKPRSFLYGVGFAFLGVIMLIGEWIVLHKSKAYPV